MLEKFRAKTSKSGRRSDCGACRRASGGTSAETERALQTEQTSAPNPHDTGKAKSKPDAGAKKGKRS